MANKYKVIALTNIYSDEYHYVGSEFIVDKEEYEYLKNVNAIELCEEIKEAEEIKEPEETKAEKPKKTSKNK